MNYPNIDGLRARPFLGVAIALLAAVLLLTGAACGGQEPSATATPEFSLPTALPSPEAVPTTGAGSEATAASTSAYWDAPRTWA